LLSYDRLVKKPLLFKSFTGFTVQEFDEIYDKGITKRYIKHEIQRLFKRKNRERDIGAGRHFTLDKKSVSYAFDILSSVHNLQLAGFSCLIWIKRATFVEIFKRLNIKYD
jgi:hypothetical protein